MNGTNILNCEVEVYVDYHLKATTAIRQYININVLMETYERFLAKINKVFLPWNK